MTTTLTVPRRTRGKLSRALLAGIAGAALATGAALAEDAHVNSMTFDVSSPYQMAVVNVTSSNGKRWDTILPGNVGFHAIMQVDTRHPGYVERAGIFLGKCTNTDCANNPRVFFDWPGVRDYNKSADVTFSVDKLKSAAPSIFGQSYGETILAECNKGLTADGATKPHTKLIAPDASFSVNTRKSISTPVGGEVAEDPETQPFNGGDHTRHGAFLVKIECLATAKTTGQPPNDPHRTKVTAQDIDLFLSTYAVPETGPRGTTCKPLKVTTRIGTDKAGPVNVKLWRQVNGGPISSEAKQMHAEALGGAKFGDDWNKFEHFTKTTTVQYKAEVLGGTFAPSTPWKSITIHCNGDFAAPQSNANPDNIPPRGQPQGQRPLPPAIVTPLPPAPCASGKTAKRGSSAPCIKTAPLPDKRREFAEQKRKAAQEAELRRREVALKNAQLQQRQQQQVHRPLGFGRFTGPARPMRGPVMGVGIMYKTF